MVINGLVQDGRKTASSDAFIAHAAALDLLFAALGLFPFVAQSGGHVLLSVSPGSLISPIK